jgi:hypothetical protein
MELNAFYFGAALLRKLERRFLMTTGTDNTRHKDWSAPDLTRRYMQLLVFVSVILSLVTFASYALQGHGILSAVLFLIGLGGENNIGSWWSGMLLLVGAVHAFDGYTHLDNAKSARKGWLTLALVLLLLSFDEVSSVHEYVANVSGRLAWLPLGAIGFVLVTYSILQLAKSGVGKRSITLIIVSFTMLGTIVLQEHFQHAISWSNPVVYGIRAFIEEGTEVAAMLILVFVTMANSQCNIERDRVNLFEATVVLRQLILLASIVTLPLLVWATFFLPFPGGPADWLAESLYLFCALRVIRAVIVEQRQLNARVLLLLFLYIGASAMSSVMSLDYNPAILGVPVSIRGVGVCAILIAAGPILRSNGRETTGLWIVTGAVVALIAVLYPQSQMIWCSIPPAVAIWIYSMESKTGRRRRAEA